MATHHRQDVTAGGRAGIPGHRTKAEATVGVILLACVLVGLQFCGGAAPPVAAPTPPPTTAKSASPLAITTSTLPDATGGGVYDASLAASGGAAPLTWAVSGGALPAGITMSPGGVIGGIPSASGVFQFTARASDSTTPPNSATAQLTLDVSSSALSLLLPRYSPATQGSAFTDGDNADGAATGGALVAISGGTGPYTCSLTSGSLPSGMTMAAVVPPIYPNGLCVVSGTPTQAGDFPLTVEVQDAAQNTSFQAVTFEVVSSSPPVISNATATSASDNTEVISWTTSVPAASKVCYSQVYDLNRCTPETDTAGVLLHAVTLSGLWQNNSYEYMIESRGVASGAPQDYLTATDQNPATFSTAAAPTTGVTTLFMDVVGPHNVMPGYPLIVGIYYGPALGFTSNADAVFTITGLPPFTKVHWPDQQDGGGVSGSISATTSPDDTITLSGMGGNGDTEFEILTNVGGTTPAGSYILTVTGSVTQGGSAVSTLNTTWNIGVVTPTFQASKATVFPAIPDLALWQTDMTTPWPGNVGQPAGGNWYNGGQRTNGYCVADNDDQGVQYYDGAWVYDQIGIYTGNLAYWTVGSSTSPCPTSAGGHGPQGAAAAMALYHQLLVNDNYNVPGFWNFPHGLYYACVTGGNAQACADLHGLANGSDGSVTSRFDATNVREGSYALGLRRLDYDAGGSSTLAQVQQLATQAVGYEDAIANGTVGDEQPFMDGLLAQALLEYYLDPKTGNQSDPRIPPAIQALADHIWAVDWIPRTGGNGLCIYNLLFENNGVQVESGGSDMRVLNLLIAPLYGWLYEQTGQAKYLEEGDAIWDSGVTDNPSNGLGWSGKNFSQQYRWSFDYVLWRSQ